MRPRRPTRPSPSDRRRPRSDTSTRPAPSTGICTRRPSVVTTTATWRRSRPLNRPNALSHAAGRSRGCAGSLAAIVKNDASTLVRSNDTSVLRRRPRCEATFRPAYPWHNVSDFLRDSPRAPGAARAWLVPVAQRFATKRCRGEAQGASYGPDAPPTTVDIVRGATPPAMDTWPFAKSQRRPRRSADERRFVTCGA